MKSDHKKHRSPYRTHRLGGGTRAKTLVQKQRNGILPTSLGSCFAFSPRAAFRREKDLFKFISEIYLCFPRLRLRLLLSTMSSMFF